MLTVKIEDHRSANGHFWLDYESKTSVGFTLAVTDLGTGGNTRYSHPEGQRTSFTDHAAF